ncbi:sensor histidine kinase [Tahibacter soli]|uniref:Histidine kinase n=1 Tax=Tahibacter soli TaxID=2983605 RepID=A0A9X4BIE8_9GAMM|nr:histidine kinase [Tahibacter soli]MDC8012162.1 histidine kinase [Tahibacter soli]
MSATPAGVGRRYFSGLRGATRRMLATVAAATILWTVYGLVYADELALLPDASDPRLTWPQAFAYTFVTLLACWIPITLFLVAVARRVVPSRRTLGASAVKLAAAVVVVLVLHAAYFAAIGPWLDAWAPDPIEPAPSFATQLARSFRFNVVRTLMLLAVCYAWVRMQNTFENRLRIAELESGLSRARLDTLSAQLNPHFLFNALNSIAELIHIDQDAADRMLVALSALLRRSLASPGHEVAVRDEVALVGQYLSIEQIRLGDRLGVRWAVDPDCLHALVPTLMLQPLAENAIVHGIARRRAPGVVEIAIRRTRATLVVEVSDDGSAADAPQRDTGSGIGLANTRSRLRCLYGDRWSLTLHTGDDARSVVRVELPLRFSMAQDLAARAVSQLHAPVATP